MKKTILFLVLISIFYFSVTPKDFTYAEKTVIDINGHWANNEINEWLDKGVVNGYKDKTFRPNDNISKAEFITLINNIYGFKEGAGINYKDVKDNAWYSKGTLIAKSNRYMDWYKSEKLHPNDRITRAEVCAIIASILKSESNNTEKTLEIFRDKNDIEEWSKSYIALLVEKGFLKGYPDGTCRAEEYITRAEVVTLLHKVAGWLITETGEYNGEVQKVIEGNVTISSSNVSLSNYKIKGDLILAASIGDGEIYLDNIIVEGKTIVDGGGENSIYITGSDLKEIVVVKIGNRIRVVSKESKIAKVLLDSNSKLEGDFKDAEVHVLAKNESIEFTGDFSSIIIDANADVKVTDDTIVENLIVGEKANGTTIESEKDTKIGTITFNSSATVKGEGAIEKAVVNSNNVEVEQKVKNKETAEGVESDKVITDSNNTNTGNSSSGTTTDTTSPEAGDSGNITTPHVSNSSITINWTKGTDNITSEENLKYLVYYSTSNDIDTVTNISANGTAVGSYTSDINTKEITGLNHSTTYYFNVIVKDEAGNKSIYNTIQRTTLEGIEPTVGNSGTLTSSNIGANSITINWTKGTDNVSAQGNLQYLVYYSTSNNIDTVTNIVSNGTAVGSYTADINTKEVTGLNDSTTYYFNVIVRDEAGNSSIYNTITETTTDATNPVVGNSGTLTSMGVGDNSITISWTKGTDNVSAETNLQYLVYYSTSNNIDTVTNIASNGTEVGSYTADINTKEVTGLNDSTTYYFNVIVRDEAGNSSVYNTITETTTDATNPVVGNTGTLTSSDVGANSITINWDKGTDNVSAQGDLEYVVYYSTSNNIDTVLNIENNEGNPEVVAVGNYTSDINTKEVTGLNDSTTYYFNVIVQDEAGNKSAYNMKSQATSDIVAPTVGNAGTLTSSNVGAISITLNWTKGTDNVSVQGDLEYLVYYSTSNNIDTLANIEANEGNPEVVAVGNYTSDINTKTVTGLNDSTTYYFNVIVKDEAGNKSAYNSITETTTGSFPSSYIASATYSEFYLGTYNYDDIINGKVSYKHTTYDDVIIYWSTTNIRWVIDSDAGVLFYNTSNTALPPTNEWIWNDSGAEDEEFVLTPQY